jgi:hypothetical protein
MAASMMRARLASDRGLGGTWVRYRGGLTTLLAIPLITLTSSQETIQKSRIEFNSIFSAFCGSVVRPKIVFTDLESSIGGPRKQSL